jgi:hypothetical protein
MLVKPKDKKSLIKALQETSDFNVLLVDYGKGSDLAAKVRKLNQAKEMTVIVIGFR